MFLKMQVYIITVVSMGKLTAFTKGYCLYLQPKITDCYA